MSVRLAGHIELPAHRRPGGFDHAAIHQGAGDLFERAAVFVDE